MNEYIKYFDNLDQAEGYEIRAVPFSGYIKEPHLALFSKRWGDIKEDKVSYDRYVFYTTNDGSTIELSNSSEFPELLENAYPDVEGVMVFNDSITSFGEGALSDYSITSIVLPNSVSSISPRAFTGCTNLNSISFNGKADLWLKVNKLKNWYGDAASGYIPATVILCKDELIPIYLRLEYTTTDGGALSPQWSYIKGTVISDVQDPITQYRVLDVDDPYNCFGLSNTNLTSIRFIGEWKNIPSLSGNMNLITVELPSTLNSIKSGTFLNTGIYNDPGLWHQGVLYVDNYAYQAKGLEITDCVLIKKGTIGIADNCFYGSSGDTDHITSVVFPEGMKFIGAYCFYSVLNLLSISFSDSITHIHKGAFSACSNLYSIVLPKELITLGFTGTTMSHGPIGVFLGCSSLINVVFRDKIKEIDAYSFYDCTSLTSITCEATTPPTLGSYNDLSSVTAVYVPAESVDAYKSATNWSYYSNVIQPIL